MAYKVLGQTTTTAATAPVGVNLIYNGANYGYTSANTTTNNLSNSGYGAIPGVSAAAITAGRYWTGQGNSSSSVYVGSSGSGSSVWIFNNPGSNYSEIGLRYGASPTTSSFYATSATGIPVVAGTTYYFGITWSAYSPPTNFTGTVYWSDAGGTQITNDTLFSTGTNGRVTTNKTAPANSAYASFKFLANATGGNYYQGLYLSDFSMSTSNTYATTYPNPVTDTSTYPGYVSNVAPFDYKLKGFSPSSSAPNAPTVLNAAGAQVTLYTTPAGSSAVVSTLSVNNTGNVATTYRYAVVPSGQTIAKKHWIALDISIPANSTTAYTIGQTLAAGDKIVVAADTADVAFTAFGNES